ncbi:hypothetical protein GGS24DRAFT_88915 [Hypoxylon argillaceum]|nr:hypothetical protein GGS24DRAFT_88915 [Hypoxylon argillaceum]
MNSFFPLSISCGIFLSIASFLLSTTPTTCSTQLISIHIDTFARYSDSQALAFHSEYARHTYSSRVSTEVMEVTGMCGSPPSDKRPNQFFFFFFLYLQNLISRLQYLCVPKHHQ